MSLASLKDELKTGIDSLDYEHRRLIGVMEELCDSFDRTEYASAESAGAISDSFGALYAAVSAHFALEESLMREKKHPSFDDHKADHERLLDKIRVMIDAYEDGQCVDCGTSLRACLEAWFVGHVRGADTELRSLAE